MEAIAAAQHGAFSRTQALAAGFSPSKIARRLEAGEWRAVDDGVYVLRGSHSSWLQSVMIACLATKGIASHLTAGRLWSLALPRGRGAQPVDVIVAAARRPRSTRTLRVHRTRAEVPSVTLQGIGCSDLGPTLIQLAEVLDVRALERAVDSASLLRPGLLYWLADMLVASRRGHGSSLKFRDLIIELLPDDGQTLDAVLAPLGPVARQHQGLDFAWPARKIALQIFNHQDQGQWQHFDGLQQQGWKILVTHAHERPKALLRRVRAALKAR